MKKLLIIFLLFSNIVVAKDKRPDLSTEHIAPNLKKNALAVIRDYTHTFTLETPKNGREKVVKIISVLNKKGESFANFSTYTDKFRKLANFSATVYDASGNYLKKFNKSDLKTSEWTTNLSSDDFIYFLDINIPNTPYTVVFKYEKKWKNGILSFPTFAPQHRFNLSVENAKYKLVTPINSSVLIATNSYITEPKQTTDAKEKTYTWAVENLTSIKAEPYSESIENLTPILRTAPEEFIYDDIHGKISSIPEIIEWQKQLNKGRELIPQELKDKVKEITQNLVTPEEKVKALYDFLGNTTRYESIQLGIGGLQPSEAREVSLTGFGDCKGLTNYMKALLKSVGIKSNYCIIKSSNTDKELAEDFTSYIESNHIILQVPLEKETIWLECTNPQIPFGYVHRNIAGHQCVVVSDNEKQLTKLPIYTDSLHTDYNESEIILNENGAAEGSSKNRYALRQYEYVMHLPKKRKKEQLDFLKRNLKLPSVEILSYDITESKTATPHLTIDYKWKTSFLGNKMGSRLFVPINITRTEFPKYNTEKRTSRIIRHNGYKDINKTTLKIPENYTVESLPKSIRIETQFGSFSSKLSQENNNVIIEQELLMKSGEWAAHFFNDFSAFLNQISKNYKEKIVLKISN